MTAAEFRAAYPEFTSATTYPNGTVDSWLATAEKLVSPDRWGDLRDRAVGLCAAHYLTIATGNLKKPGSAGGAVSSKSVDAISVSFSEAGMQTGSGQWNATNYGRTYISLARMIGAGGVVV